VRKPFVDVVDDDDEEEVVGVVKVDAEDGDGGSPAEMIRTMNVRGAMRMLGRKVCVIMLTAIRILVDIYKCIYISLSPLELKHRALDQARKKERERKRGTNHTSRSRSTLPHLLLPHQ